jgi:hypothetical protein
LGGIGGAPILTVGCGSPLPIDDSVACTSDSCDEVGDVVVDMPDDSRCMDAGGPCTAPTCGPILGCTTVPVPGCTVEVPVMPVWGRAVLVLFFAFGSLALPWVHSVRARGNRSKRDLD